MNNRQVEPEGKGEQSQDKVRKKRRLAGKFMILFGTIAIVCLIGAVVPKAFVKGAFVTLFAILLGILSLSAALTLWSILKLTRKELIK